MPNQKDIKRFAIHKNYGIDINGKKRKAEYYQLIEKIGNRTNIIMQVFPSQYGILVAKKKELMRSNPNFYNTQMSSLNIIPIFT